MKLEEARVCILRVGGTNCDAETMRAFQDSGMKAEIVHYNQLVRQQNLLDYHILVIPGGFSHGDYVRAGAIWAKRLMAKLGREVERFVDEGRPILGICNGFQVLVEAGLLPGFDGVSQYPLAALATNIPPGYNCRWTHLRYENKGKCVFTKKVSSKSVVRVPVAHSEGRFMFGKENEGRYFERLLENDQLVFRYSCPDGEYAEGEYPSNPNGSFHDIAAICDPSGTVFGLMPHPERAYFGWQLPDWTRGDKMPGFGDGKLVFESVAGYLSKRL
ncbi:MAG: phosphoribosylformylglycinamidine synthase subunit PurQ [Candidatus Bathyarchaeia archaeon]